QTASRSCAPEVLLKLRAVPFLAGTEKRSPRATTVVRSPSGARFTDSRCLDASTRSEEHTSELQSRVDLVCRLLLEKKKNVVLEGLSTAYPHFVHTSHEDGAVFRVAIPVNWTEHLR